MAGGNRFLGCSRNTRRRRPACRTSRSHTERLEPRLLTPCPAFKAMGKAGSEDQQEAARVQCPLPPRPPPGCSSGRMSSTLGSLKGLNEALSKCPVAQMVTGVPRKVGVDQSPQAGHWHQHFSSPASHLAERHHQEQHAWDGVTDRWVGARGCPQEAELSLPSKGEDSGGVAQFSWALLPGLQQHLGCHLGNSSCGGGSLLPLP